MPEPTKPMTADEFSAITDAAEIVDASSRIALALKRGEEAMEILALVGDYGFPSATLTDRYTALLKGQPK